MNPAISRDGYKHGYWSMKSIEKCGILWLYVTMIK